MSIRNWGKQKRGRGGRRLIENSTVVSRICRNFVERIEAGALG
jgi:hypothetical protein